MSTLTKKNNVFPAANSFFDDFFTKDWFDWNNKNFTAIGNTLPSVNVKETDKSFNIELAAPGMKKDDFKIELKNDMLTISSEKEDRREEKDKEGNYTRREFNYQSFCRSFSMPDTANSEKIDAEYQNGILQITIAKKEGAKTPASKTISVK